MEKDFLVLWAWFNAPGNLIHDAKTAVMRVKYSPHEPPRGSHLRDILADEIWDHHNRVAPVLVLGAVELPPAAWNNNMVLEMATYDGRVASVECTSAGWRLTA